MRPIQRVLLLWLVLRLLEEQSRDEERRRRRRRRFWVHPTVSQIHTKRHFNNLYMDLRQHPEKFVAFCRMSIQAFDKLLEELRPGLTFKDTFMRYCISAEERLVITLRFLATGMSFSDLHLHFLVGRSTISTIVHSTCQQIWTQLKNTVMPETTEQQWLQIVEGFYANSQFPNCLGALGGKRIRVKWPPLCAPQYHNSELFFSVLVLGLVDSNYRFITISIQSCESSNDSQISTTSIMGQQLLVNPRAIPQPRVLLGSSGPPAPFVIVADEAFDMSNHVLRPFSCRGMDNRRRIYNCRLTKARKYVEYGFGLLFAKWQLLSSAIQLDEPNVTSVIQACVILHNFVRMNDTSLDQVMEVPESFTLPNVIQDHSARLKDSGLKVRNQYADYFMTPEGRVPWQDDDVGKHA
ncbi:uncharacterized protein [Ranitomeya imitator]|uniref:uncharacterized protein n=1 Tax=Ranitomeya imitator TaxID=111125 RepID=UPI0037E7587B